MEQPITFAVIGVGLIGPRHAQTIVENPDSKLIAIVDPESTSILIANTFGVAYYPSVAALLASEHKPDAAIVCTPNHTHVDISIDLIEAGVSVLVEKPISHDITSGRRLIDVASQKGAKLLVGHHRRFNPFSIAVKRLIDSGCLGVITAVNGLWTACKPAEYFEGTGSWRTTVDGGVININLIHDVDLLQYLCGDIIRVFAESVQSKRGHTAEEGAAITFRFSSGAVGTFLVGDNLPSPHNFESGTGENPMIPRTGENFYRIFGSEGVLSIPQMTVASYRDAPHRSWTQKMTIESVDVTTDTPFQLQMQHFVSVVRGQQTPSCTGESALASLIVCDAIKKSIETHMPVNIGSEPDVATKQLES